MAFVIVGYKYSQNAQPLDFSIPKIVIMKFLKESTRYQFSPTLLHFYSLPNIATTSLESAMFVAFHAVIITSVSTHPFFRVSLSFLLGHVKNGLGTSPLPLGSNFISHRRYFFFYCTNSYV